MQVLILMLVLARNIIITTIIHMLITTIRIQVSLPLPRSILLYPAPFPFIWLRRSCIIIPGVLAFAVLLSLLCLLRFLPGSVWLHDPFPFSSACLLRDIIVISLTVPV